MSKAELEVDPLVGHPSYRMVEDIGRGGFGRVLRAQHLESGENVAIKLLRLDHSYNAEYVNKEVLNYRRLRHPHVVEFRELIVIPKYLGIVMEWCSGGTLLDYARSQKRVLEPLARWYFQQLVLGLHYCHTAAKVVIRDVKLENLLLSPVDGLPQPLLKICDFGFSKHLIAHSAPTSQVGTTKYVSPEVLNCGGGVYDGVKADVWSSGVVLYALLVNRFPFSSGKDQLEIIKEISSLTQDKVDKTLAQLCLHLSPGCLSLLRRLLMVDPVERVGLQEVLLDPWFRECLPLGSENMACDDDSAAEDPISDMQPLAEVQQLLQQACANAAVNRRAALLRQEPELWSSGDEDSFVELTANRRVGGKSHATFRSNT